MTMFNVFRGQRPDVTPAQVVAVLVAGVPAVATLGSVFGIADLTREQQDALSEVLKWSTVLAGLLIGGDATLRTARNMGDAKRDAAAMLAGSTGGGPVPQDPADPNDPEVDAAESAVYVSDEEEFAETADSVKGKGDIDDPAARVDVDSVDAGLPGDSDEEY
jgi:hypothetical protein